MTNEELEEAVSRVLNNDETRKRFVEVLVTAFEHEGARKRFEEEVARMLERELGEMDQFAPLEVAAGLVRFAAAIYAVCPSVPVYVDEALGPVAEDGKKDRGIALGLQQIAQDVFEADHRMPPALKPYLLNKKLPRGAGRKLAEHLAISRVIKRLTTLGIRPTQNDERREGGPPSGMALVHAARPIVGKEGAKKAWTQGDGYNTLDHFSQAFDREGQAPFEDVMEAIVNLGILPRGRAMNLAALFAASLRAFQE